MKDAHTSVSVHFSGFISPNGTIVPDQAFDELMPLLTGAEWKVLCYIIRRTFGFKKTTDTISLSQICRGITTRDGRVLDHGTGLSKATAVTAIRGLLKKGAITTMRNRSSNRGDEPTTYALRFQTSPANPAADLPVNEHADKPIPPLPDPVSKNQTPPVSKNQTGRVQKSDTQRTVLQPTAKYQSNSSNRKKLERQEEVLVGAHAATPPTKAGFKTLSELLAARVVIPAAEAPVPRPAAKGSRRGLARTKTHRVTDSSTKSTPAQEAVLQASRTSARIADLIRSISEEFGDPKINANISQAERLWARSGMSEQAFLDWLYLIRSDVRLHRATIRKPLAYFFRVLRTRLRLDA